MNRDEFLDLYFRELDLGPRWVQRQAPGVAADEAPVDEPLATAAIEVPQAATNRLPQRDSLRSQKNVANATPDGPVVNPAANPLLDDAGWEALEASIRACRVCGLCRQRRQAVPGVGDRQADWLFIGEGPGADEDVKGEPFVGQAGKLLDNMLMAIGLKRGEDVYIANAVKCRPPNNRTPEAAEMAACRPYLERQIALLQPQLIVLLGKAAVHSVLGLDDALGGLRGRLHRFGEIPVVVTYHPAYLLRNLPDKAKAWEDLCLARRTMRQLRAGSA